jgi:hypothetical protein
VVKVVESFVGAFEAEQTLGVVFQSNIFHGPRFCLSWRLQSSLVFVQSIRLESHLSIRIAPSHPARASQARASASSNGPCVSSQSTS